MSYKHRVHIGTEEKKNWTKGHNILKNFLKMVFSDELYAQSTYRGRGEIGGVFLPSQLERTPLLCS
jgi:hypothetical protein